MTERGGVTAVTFVPAARGRDGRRSWAEAAGSRKVGGYSMGWRRGVTAVTPSRFPRVPGCGQERERSNASL
jgi:hypothetical protein